MRVIILTGLAIVFFVSAHFFISVYGEAASQRLILESLEKKEQQLNRQRQDQARKRHLVEKADRFVADAIRYDIVRDRWQEFGVNIDENLSFTEARKILEQTTNTTSYYFKPIMLHIKKIGKSLNEEQNNTSGRNQELLKGEVLFTLKGTFIVSEK